MTVSFFASRKQPTMRARPGGQVMPMGNAQAKLKGARYSLVNTSSTIPVAGQLLVPPSGLTIRLHGIDLDATNHGGFIDTMKAGDSLTIGAETVVLSAPPIPNSGYFSIQLVALPGVQPDGVYTVTATIA
jgi:hypothetical protein